MSQAGEGRIGRYEILAELGRGAMGIVHKARDPQLDRIVAIKSLRTDLGLAPEIHADLKRRFYQEASAAGRLSHPAIVAVHDVLEIGDTPYIVMEYVEGQTLAGLVRAEGPLPPQQAADIVLQVCGALEAAHARGVVHRDIKPSNILVNAWRDVKVGDFGIARIADRKYTQTGTLLGSPAYMSPEQVLGKAVDGRSDLFSLGVVLYEVLTGAEPFAGEHPSTILYNIVHGEPIPIRERNPAVSPGFEAVLGRALAKDPADRYPTAQAFAEGLQAALGRADGGSDASAQATVVLQPVPAKGRRRLAAAGAGCLLVVAAGGAWLWARGTRDVVKAPAPPIPAAKGPAPPPGVQPAVGAPTRGASPGAQETGPAPVKASTPPRGARATPRTGSGGGGTTAAPPPPSQPQQRPAGSVGGIRVTTDPDVEVFLDGQLKGRAGKGPMLLADVPAGEHVVTLRSGSFEQRFRHTVRENETLPLTFHFQP